MPQSIEMILQIAMALIGAYVAALWFCLVVWTFRDIQRRTRDIVVQILATLLVLLFNVPGLMLYLILRPPETLSESYARSLGEAALIRDIARRDLCPNCEARVEADFRVCPSCRAALRSPCVRCDKLVDTGWSICPYCTTPVSQSTVVEALEQEEPAFRVAPSSAEALARGRPLLAAHRDLE